MLLLLLPKGCNHQNAARIGICQA